MKNIIFAFSAVLFALFCLNACNANEKDEVQYQCPMKCEGDKSYHEPIKCPICNMDLLLVDADSKIESDEIDISDESIFNLTSKWVTQNQDTIELKELNGDVLVVVMIYTTCKAACPRLVADMRMIKEDVKNPAVRYVLVSIDPESDTPEKLKAFAIENEMDNDQWVFLQGTPDDVREFSNVLAVKYKRISPLDFSHSNIITVFDKGGVLYFQKEGLGVDNEEIVGKILELTGG